MTGARGILAAGLVAVAATSAHAVYRSWPAAYGVEICVTAALYRQPADVPIVGVGLPLERLELDVVHVPPAVAEPFERVRAVGDWWKAGTRKDVNASLRGRRVYIQLTAGQPLWPGGPVQMRPDTVSDTVVAGAVNLEATVARARDDGYLWLLFPFGVIPGPGDVAAHARPPAGAQPRSSQTGVDMPASDPGVFAVLRVLPSGRSALVAVIVNGQRY